jgi:hypothetical protein
MKPDRYTKIVLTLIACKNLVSKELKHADEKPTASRPLHQRRLS